ncbi:hypothetical protein ABIG06_006891 [Bradyrhizobium sp. USDA 326]|uniref:hypothetical protein n=1 Tax=Bradyrhizobium sp. USDA 326 TaxID=3377726 RepID=UPI003C70B27E
MPMPLQSGGLRRVYVAWQEPATRQWHTIARLTRVGGEYEFSFTRGAEKVAKVVQGLFNSRLTEHYVSTELISLFKNKIPPRSRSDFHKLAHWLNLRGDESEFDMLGKFGLIPGSDGLLVYSEPLISDAHYSVEFFVHGIRHVHGGLEDRHLHGDVLKWCESVSEGDQLLPMLDVQNQFDGNCIALRADEGTIVIGYVPRFYAPDMKIILSDPVLASTASFKVLRNNFDAPLQFRLLCRFESAVKPGFNPFDDSDHEAETALVPLSI